MGTDIYPVFQAKAKDVAKFTGDQTPVKDPEEWIEIESGWDQNRHYLLFAVLADVRNGFGFAGSYRHEPLRPIVEELRGYPEDYPVNSHGEPTPDLGYHSHHWLLGSEMLDWARLDRSLVFGGVLSREDFQKWDGISIPSGVIGTIWGNDIIEIVDKASAARCYVSVDEEQNTKETGLMATPPSNWTHIRVWWRASLLEQLDYFFNGIIKPLMEKYGEIRLVMGFD